MKRRLTSEQRKIIDEIKRLYWCKEPLNITAVKHRHPELMKAVYDIKPFWGWKRALEDAGIDYGEINIELLEYCVCELCGKECRNLANHARLKHGVSADDYLIDYPEADLICEQQRAQFSKMKSAILPHWERIWSREYVLDRIEVYRRLGNTLHHSWAIANDNPLYTAAHRHSEGWSNALRAIGIDPKDTTREAYRRMRRYQDAASVTREIKRRQRRGLSVSFTALYRRHGVNACDVALLVSGAEYFGSWENALKAAGLDPEVMRQAVKPKRKYETQKDVIREIRARYKRKWKINHGEIYHGKNQNAILGICAREYFGSWNNALAAAGFDAAAVTLNAYRESRRYPSKESVIKEIKRRKKKGLPITLCSMETGPYRDPALGATAREYFGSWNKALQAAGVDTEELMRRICWQRRRYPDKKSVISEIKRRRKAGLRLKHRSLTQGCMRERDWALLESGCQYFGSWGNALNAAGLNPKKLRKKGKEVSPRGRMTDGRGRRTEGVRIRQNINVNLK